MSYGLLLIAAALSCVSARFTVPVPVHYEVEAQFQKQTGTKMRWDPTNYLTYLAAVYSQCSHLYSGSSLQRGRVPNATAYGNLLTYFDPSLLQSNLAVFAWDVSSDESQDAGTVDRDIRKLFGKSNGVGALGNIASIDTNLRNYDRFGCSIETTCKSAQTSVMTLVCVFGQTTAPRQVAGTGGSQAPATSRPVPATRAPVATTTRARARVTTAAARTAAGGFYETYSRDSEALYLTVINDFNAPETVTNYKTSEVISFEQKLTALGLCKYENDPNGLSADMLQGFDPDVQVTFYSASPSPLPSAQDMTASPISNNAKNAILQALGNRVGGDLTAGQSVACSWALCSQKVVAACAVWGPAADYTSEQTDNYE